MVGCEACRHDAHDVVGLRHGGCGARGFQERRLSPSGSTVVDQAVIHYSNPDILAKVVASSVALGRGLTVATQMLKAPICKPELLRVSQEIRRSFALPQPLKRRSRHPSGRNFVAQLGGDPVARRISRTASEKLKAFASLSSSSSQETYSVGVNPQVGVPPPSSSIGSPLFWIGVGVGLSTLFTWVASNLKQAFKTMMGMPSQYSQFGNAVFPSGSPFPFPPPPTSGPPSPSRPAASQSVITLDVPVTKVEASPVSKGKSEVMKGNSSWTRTNF